MEKRDKDGFWDIEKLLPKRNASRLTPFATDTPVVDYAPDEEQTRRECERLGRYADVSHSADSEGSESYGAESKRYGLDREGARLGRHGAESCAADCESSASEYGRDPSERKLTTPHNTGVRESTEESYEPTGQGLVKRVTVRRFIDKYDFYDGFRKSALLYFDCNAQKCDFAQFYSYMPQYAHLTPSQKNYYFWWRSELRRGRYPRTDYSYLYLYVYEIINLPDKIPPEQGLRLLTDVWREYRAALPRIDMYFAIWIEDYCLVHRLPAPMREISDFLFDCIGTAPLKEFFLSDINEVGLSGTESLLCYLSDYDWRRGKYASGEGLSASVLKDGSYRTHMQRAMYLLLSEIWDAATSGEGAKRATLVRDAFPNTLCTHSVKCKLEIEYVSFTDSAELRSAVTAAVRYTENKLRALLGVKSRLAVKGLPESYAAVIDRYFARHIAEEAKRREIASRPAYERLYEAPAVRMSLDGAAEIERLSWENARRLVPEDESAAVYVWQSTDEPVAAHAEKSADALYNNEPAPTDAEQSAEPHAEDTAENICDSGTVSLPPTTDTYGLSPVEIGYIKKLLGLPTDVQPTLPPEALAERINDAFAEHTGDILLEVSDGGYKIIEDYREDALSFICSLQ